MQIGDSDLLAFYQNGTVQDWTDGPPPSPGLRIWIRMPWRPAPGPTAKLYCIPVAQTPQVVFVWKDRFPAGYPTTPEAFLTQAAALKAEGLYPITFFGSTDFDGEGLTVLFGPRSARLVARSMTARVQ